MTQKRIEEKIDAIEQDLTELKVIMQGVSAIEATLLALTQGVEKLSIMVDRQQKWVEETSRTSEEDPASVASSRKEGKSVETGDQSGETSTVRSGNEKNPFGDHESDRSKFKKVEMPVFNGEDPDG